MCGTKGPEASAAGLLALRWALQAGAAIVPRSSRVEHVAANAAALALPPLADDEMRAFAALDANLSLYGLHEIFVHDDRIS